MNGLSLCSGVGGIDLGLRLAVPGYRTVCHVEVDRRCQDVLLARMAAGVLDRAPIWGDLRRFDGRQWRGLVDVVHGGYPCQPFSRIGRRRGTDDARHLWPDIVRIVRECEPEWCLFENVAGHLSLGARDVVRDLRGMGYRVAVGAFTAAELGAPHERERLFILAHADVLGTEAVQARGAVADGRGAGRAGVQGGGPADAAVDYPRPWPPHRSDPDWGDVVKLDPSLHPAVEEHERARTNPAFTEWLMGFPRGWTEGASRSARVQMHGNAVVPAMAALAWIVLSSEVNRPTVAPTAPEE